MLKILPFKNGDEISLKKSFGKEDSALHRKRAKPKENIYCIAWLDSNAVGHLLLRLAGAKEPFLKGKIKNCPHIEGVAVTEQFQGQGIGTRLIQKAEGIAKQKGFVYLGLAVNIENERAIKLYQKLGYQHSKFGTFKSSYSFKDPQGKRIRCYEKCVYLVKKL